MTEEIIVNGFDVSECYADNKMMKDGLYCFWEGGNCEDNEYCYYKELKRLEQENNALQAYKDINEDFKKAWDELNKKYTEVLKLAKENADSNEYCLQELEKENKELKEEKLYRGIDRQFIEDANDRLYFKAEKYRKALEEIKNVLKEICKEECDYTKPKFCGDCDCRYGQILNKINEVINENN